MKPDYAEAAKKLKEQNSKGILAAIDASKEKRIATQYDVKGFPTVKYFKDGKFAWDFNERSLESLVNFMKECVTISKMTGISFEKRIKFVSVPKNRHHLHLRNNHGTKLKAT